MGDFNVVCLQEERTGSSVTRSERHLFNQFISENNLIGFDREGHIFTF